MRSGARWPPTRSGGRPGRYSAALPGTQRSRGRVGRISFLEKSGDRITEVRGGSRKGVDPGPPGDAVRQALTLQLVEEPLGKGERRTAGARQLRGQAESCPLQLARRNHPADQT